jgi:hypothetical protein
MSRTWPDGRANRNYSGGKSPEARVPPGVCVYEA